MGDGTTGATRVAGGGNRAERAKEDFDHVLPSFGCCLQLPRRAVGHEQDGAPFPLP